MTLLTSITNHNSAGLGEEKVIVGLPPLYHHLCCILKPAKMRLLPPISPNIKTVDANPWPWGGGHPISLN